MGDAVVTLTHGQVDALMSQAHRLVWSIRAGGGREDAKPRHQRDPDDESAILLDDGHEVMLHARSDKRAAALGTVQRQALGVAVGDLAIATDVHNIADQVNAIGPMDAVIYNADVYNMANRGSTPEHHANCLRSTPWSRKFRLRQLNGSIDRLI